MKSPTPGARASRPRTLFPQWRSRGRLPHWEGGEVPQSITFRLADSLPREAVKRVLAEPMPALKRERFEALLDAGHGEGLLALPGIGEIVQSVLLHFDEDRYRLHAWCVMPNHVHALATPVGETTLSGMVHSWKSFSAKAINAELGRGGPVWFEEYFDRFVRDDAHFHAVKSYIENNPVEAGLCAAAEDWPVSSARAVAGGTPAP